MPTGVDMRHYDALVEWVHKYRPHLVKLIGAGGVANIMLDGLDQGIDIIRKYESYQDWILTNG